MKNLIEKYFEGETSLREEAELRRYFNSGNVEESLRQYEPLFRHFENEREWGLSDEFDQKLLAKLEGGARIVPMRNWQRTWLRVAAMGAVLIGAFFYLQRPVLPAQQQAINWEKYEITDEKAAYEETVKALKLLSSKLNKGSKKAAEEVEKVEKVSKYFN
jgi:hypothetical protein